MSTGRHGSTSSRSSCISNGSALALAAAALTPAQKRSSRARSSGSSAAASRSARGGSPASASGGRSAAPPPRPSRRPGRRRRGGRSRAARAGPGRGRSPRRTRGRRRCRPRCAARPSGRGGSAPRPRARRARSCPSACGSGRRASQCQAAAVAAAASPVPASPGRQSRTHRLASACANSSQLCITFGQLARKFSGRDRYFRRAPGLTVRNRSSMRGRRGRFMAIRWNIDGGPRRGCGRLAFAGCAPAARAFRQAVGESRPQPRQAREDRDRFSAPRSGRVSSVRTAAGSIWQVCVPAGGTLVVAAATALSAIGPTAAPTRRFGRRRRRDALCAGRPAGSAWRGSQPTHVARILIAGTTPNAPPVYRRCHQLRRGGAVPADGTARPQLRRRWRASSQISASPSRHVPRRFRTHAEACPST